MTNHEIADALDMMAQTFDLIAIVPTRGGAAAPMANLLRSAALQLRVLDTAAQKVMQCLGPEPVTEHGCAGCQAEIAEALRILRAAGMTYRGRKQ